jgi:hypothetical protein
VLLADGAFDAVGSGRLTHELWTTAVPYSDELAAVVMEQLSPREHGAATTAFRRAFLYATQEVGISEQIESVEFVRSIATAGTGMVAVVTYDATVSERQAQAAAAAANAAFNQGSLAFHTGPSNRVAGGADLIGDVTAVKVEVDSAFAVKIPMLHGVAGHAVSSLCHEDEEAFTAAFRDAFTAATGLTADNILRVELSAARQGGTLSVVLAPGLPHAVAEQAALVLQQHIRASTLSVSFIDSGSGDVTVRARDFGPPSFGAVALPRPHVVEVAYDGMAGLSVRDFSEADLDYLGSAIEDALVDIVGLNPDELEMVQFEAVEPDPKSLVRIILDSKVSKSKATWIAERLLGAIKDGSFEFDFSLNGFDILVPASSAAMPTIATLGKEELAYIEADRAGIASAAATAAELAELGADRGRDVAAVSALWDHAHGGVLIDAKEQAAAARAAREAEEQEEADALLQFAQQMAAAKSQFAWEMIGAKLATTAEEKAFQILRENNFFRKSEGTSSAVAEGAETAAAAAAGAEVEAHSHTGAAGTVSTDTDTTAAAAARVANNIATSPAKAELLGAGTRGTHPSPSSVVEPPAETQAQVVADALEAALKLEAHATASAAAEAAVPLPTETQAKAVAADRANAATAAVELGAVATKVEGVSGAKAIAHAASEPRAEAQAKAADTGNGDAAVAAKVNSNTEADRDGGSDNTRGTNRAVKSGREGRGAGPNNEQPRLNLIDGNNVPAPPGFAVGGTVCLSSNRERVRGLMEASGVAWTDAVYGGLLGHTMKVASDHEHVRFVNVVAVAPDGSGDGGDGGDGGDEVVVNQIAVPWEALEVIFPQNELVPGMTAYVTKSKDEVVAALAEIEGGKYAFEAGMQVMLGTDAVIVAPDSGDDFGELVALSPAVWDDRQGEERPVFHWPKRVLTPAEGAHVGDHWIWEDEEAKDGGEQTLRKRRRRRRRKRFDAHGVLILDEGDGSPLGRPVPPEMVGASVMQPEPAATEKEEEGVEVVVANDREAASTTAADRKRRELPFQPPDQVRAEPKGMALAAAKKNEGELLKSSGMMLVGGSKPTVGGGWLFKARANIFQKRLRERQAALTAAMELYATKLERELELKMAVAHQRRAEAREDALKIAAVKVKLKEERMVELKAERVVQDAADLVRLRRAVAAKDALFKSHNIKHTDIVSSGEVPRAAGKAKGMVNGKAKERAKATAKLSFIEDSTVMTSFRRLRHPKKKRKGPTPKEQQFLEEQQLRLNDLAAAEQPALQAGHKSPHLVLLSNRWNNKEFTTSEAVLSQFASAIRQESWDGHPVVVVTYDWEISPVQLLGKIVLALTGGAASGAPQSKLRAKTIAFMVYTDMGSLFVTKYMATTHTTISIPRAENGAVQRFWRQMDLLVSASGPRTALTGEGDRSQCKIHFLSTYLEGTKSGQALADTMGAMFNGDVISVMPEVVSGKQAIEIYFQWDRYQAAVGAMQKEIRILRYGFDDEEQVELRVETPGGDSADQSGLEVLDETEHTGEQWVDRHVETPTSKSGLLALS